MAKQLKKPRLRKTAPTIREQTQAAKKDKPQKKPGRVYKRVRGTLRKIRLPRNRLTSPLFRLGGLLARFARWLVPSYFVNSWHELKQVTWPNRKETWRLTGAVFAFAIVFGIAIAIVDKGLNEIFKKLILN